MKEYTSYLDSVSEAELAKERAEQKRKEEALHLVISYATDIVDMWPTVTLRTLYKVTDKVATLKQAITEYRKYL